MKLKQRCLIIQLAGLGDTIQSLMALRAVKQLYPELEVEVVVRSYCEEAVQRIPWIEKIHVLPVEELVVGLKEGKKTENEALAQVADWLRPVADRAWDFVVNWSYSEASSWLTAVVPGVVKLGFSRKDDKTFSCEDGWSHYIQGIVQGEVQQNIHLTDILTTQLLTALQIHLGEPNDDGNVPVTSKEFFSLKERKGILEWGRRDTSRRWLSIQLGRGPKGVKWEAVNWAKLIAAILKRHPETGFVLLGSKSDREDAKKIREEVNEECGWPEDRMINLVGKTGFDEWVSVVGNSSWVISADTAVVHLASVLGTRVLNISLGQVNFSESGPYGNGHYVVCGREGVALDAGSVYSVWSYANGEWSHRQKKTIEEHFELLGHEELLSKINVFRTKIRASSEGGGVVYELALKRSLQLEDWVAIVMGQVARAWYCGWVAPVGLELKRDQIAPKLLRELREMQESASVILKVCREAVHVSLAIASKGVSLRSQSLMSLEDKKEFEEMNQKLQELDGLMERISQVHFAFKAFSQMSKVMMHNMSGNRISELAKESAENYRQLTEGVELFIDWLRYTLNLARPMDAAKILPFRRSKELLQ